MAGRRGGGGRSRMDLRREADALEAREREGTPAEVVEDEDEDEEEEDEEGEEGEEGEAEGEADPDAEASDEDDEDEDAPKKKKKAKAKVKAVKAPAKKRTRAVKEVRMRATWVVFDNAGKRAGAFPYPQKKEAEELLAAKIEEKKTTFYIQLVKEEIKEG